MLKWILIGVVCAASLHGLAAETLLITVSAPDQLPLWHICSLLTFVTTMLHACKTAIY